MTDPGAGRPFLIVHSSDEWYGADRMVAELAAVAEGASSTPVEVWVPADAPPRTPSLSSVLAERGIAVRSLDLPVLRRRSLTPGGLVALVRQTRQFRRAMAQAAPSAVVAATTAVVPALWAVPRGARSMMYVQEIWRSGERIVLGLLALPADALLTISEPVAEALPPWLRGRSVVVTNAVADHGAPVDPPQDGPLRYVVASRWNSWKGHDFLLQAWEAAGCPGELIVLGGPPEAGIAVDVPELVSRLSHPETVRIVGEVDDIEPWIDRSDVLILPSTNPEPFGLVVIEAFARARPVIATAHGAPATVVTPDVGWQVAPGDVAGFAEVLASMSRPEAVRRGRSARAAFERRYSMPAWREAVRSVLTGFLAPRRPRPGPAQVGPGEVGSGKLPPSD